MKNILIAAGEASGDLHASSLIKELKKRADGLRFFGMGGQKMRDEGASLVEGSGDLSIIGVGEVFSKLFRIHALFKKILREVDSRKPDLGILVDYPGFNLALARELNKRNIPLVYYITPQVWAWGRSRIKLIKKYFKKAVVIFKFEEDLFKKYGVDAEFAGHPLLDLEKSHVRREDARRSLGLLAGDFAIALLPGSRKQEVSKKLPLMLNTAGLILKKSPSVKFVLLESAGLEEGFYDGILKKYDTPVRIVRGDTYRCLAASDFVFTASGTATLEACIMERPMLITYKTSFLTFLLCKMFANIPPVGLVNVISGKEICPEILQYDATPKRLSSEILSIISSEGRMKEMVSGLKNVKSVLGNAGASGRAAEIILRQLR